MECCRHTLNRIRLSKKALPVPDRISPKLAPDISAAEHFLTQLDEAAEYWTFQTFDDDGRRKDPGLARIIHGAMEEHSETLSDLNQRGAGVFVTINETDFRGRKRGNIQRVRAVWQEDDGAGTHLPLEPHIVVESSPGKYHRYIFVDGLELDEHRSVQQVLVDRYGSDPCAKDVSRVLRLPGFYHRKGEPHLARIVEESHAQPYSRKDILIAFESQPTSAPVSNGSGTHTIPAGNSERSHDESRRHDASTRDVRESHFRCTPNRERTPMRSGPQCNGGSGNCEKCFPIRTGR